CARLGSSYGIFLRYFDHW
nr:immunoglobulin heavy chain junction region [Macaca mulatta]